ncbi:MAG: signal peptide peptidase SppA, partial [Kofleriaceae bacterium]
VALPLAPLAGEHDARTVSVNPGGIPLVRGTELALAIDVEDPEVATSAGPGVGAFLASSIGGGVLPRLAYGIGIEAMRPPRERLASDPGTPTRFTFGVGGQIGSTGWGVTWHHFWSERAPVDGLDTFDLGLSSRLNNYVAWGGTIRDLATGAVAQRRYELELLLRPLGTSALELAVGGRVGEDREDLDGWSRLSAHLGRGTMLHLGFETRETHTIAAATNDRVDRRDYRALVGLELSFGRFGVTAIGAGLRDDVGANHALGGSLVLRVASQPGGDIMGRPDHVERVELTGSIGVRELTGLVARLRSIARDPTAKGLVVTFDGASGGWATLEELRAEILAVKAKGKKVFAYMVSGTGRDYYVASAADKIYVDPAGGVRIVGMAGTSLFFKGAFDLLHVTPQFDKIGEYKSAPEQFTETGPSETARRMQNELFDSLYARFVGAIAESRKLSDAEVKALIDNGPYTAGDLASESGNAKKLVDAVAPPEKVAQLIATEMGVVLPVYAPSSERPDRWKRQQIAVIYVEGDIVDGKSRSVPFLGQSLAGSETLVGAISAARANPDIGAIVLRIDSPGGSALASELISREVFATRGVKPILCSLGDVAASGGYFIAAGCDLIFAEPTTITGSIGIFYGKFDVSGLAQRLGVGIEVYKRGARSDVESYFRPYTTEERAVLLEKLRYMYSRFIGAVSEGRKLTKDQVDAIGRGHVYTGAQALPIKLVDRFGGLSETLDEAKRRMGISTTTRVSLVELPNLPSSLLGKLGSLIGASADARSADVSITDLPMVKELLSGIPPALVVEPNAAMARLPFNAP